MQYVTTIADLYSLRANTMEKFNLRSNNQDRNHGDSVPYADYEDQLLHQENACVMMHCYNMLIVNNN